MERSSEIFVIGSANVDLITYSSVLPASGETLLGHTFEKGFGGKGANQAAQSKFLGSSVAVYMRLGNDLFGRDFKNHFDEQGLDTTHVQFCETSTGVASIMVADSGANAIVVVGGANNTITPEDIRSVEPQIAAANVLLCQNEIPTASTIEALRLARKHNTLSIYNPAPAPQSQFLKELLQFSDIVCPNETELQSMTGSPTPLTDLEAVRLAAQKLLDEGCRMVIATLGEKGAVIVSRDHFRHCPAPRVAAIDTVGAGDSFLGTLGANLSRMVPLNEAVERALQLASLSVTRKGSQKSFFKAEELPPELKLPEAVAASKEEVMKNALTLT